MKDHQPNDDKFSWEGLLLVSGFSFLLFSIFLYAISSPYGVFLKISIVFFGAGIGVWLFNGTVHEGKRNKVHGTRHKIQGNKAQRH